VSRNVPKNTPHNTGPLHEAARCWSDVGCALAHASTSEYLSMTTRRFEDTYQPNVVQLMQNRVKRNARLAIGESQMSLSMG
jgi:hypothetical protein